MDWLGKKLFHIRVPFGRRRDPAFLGKVRGLDPPDKVGADALDADTVGDDAGDQVETAQRDENRRQGIKQNPFPAVSLDQLLQPKPLVGQEEDRLDQREDSTDSILSEAQKYERRDDQEQADAGQPRVIHERGVAGRGGIHVAHCEQKPDPERQQDHGQQKPEKKKAPLGDAERRPRGKEPGAPFFETGLLGGFAGFFEESLLRFACVFLFHRFGSFLKCRYSPTPCFAGWPKCKKTIDKSVRGTYYLFRHSL